MAWSGQPDEQQLELSANGRIRLTQWFRFVWLLAAIGALRSLHFTNFGRPLLLLLWTFALHDDNPCTSE